jgi:hypothetical protein
LISLFGFTRAFLHIVYMLTDAAGRDSLNGMGKKLAHAQTGL